MKRILTALALILGLCPNVALADFNATAGSGLVVFGFTCFSTKVCTAWVPINSAGTELFTGANPGIATGSGTAGTAATGVLTVQGIASMTPLIVTNSGTFAVQAAQSGTWNITNISGTVSLPTGAATAANQLGTTSNASSAVATSSTNQASVAYGYGFNGTTWDQLQVDASKNLKVNVQSAVGAAQGATASGTTGSEIMGEGRSSETTAVTNGQLARLVTDLVGKLIVLPYANPENFLNGQITSAMTVTTSTALTGMGAQGAGVRVYATACTVSNTHATVDTMVNLQDGSGGTVLWQLPAGHAYNGAVVTFPTPIKTTANNGLFAVNATTGASTFLSCTGYKGI